LDDLIDGVKMLNRLSAELTEDSLIALRDADNVARNEATQLKETDGLEGSISEATARVTGQLQSARPWVDVGALQPDVARVRDAYRAERIRLLEWQEKQSEQIRASVRMRDGFSTLSTDKAHNVLRPINDAATNTSVEAIAPALRDLREPFIVRLQNATIAADRLLDQYLSDGPNPVIVPMDLSLHNREIKSEKDVDALLKEIRERLLEQLRNGQRIRLI